jgi:hypothetical protein
MTASEAKSPQKRIENTLKPTTTKVDYDVEVPVSEKAGVANRLGKNYAVNKKKNKINELLRPGVQVSVTRNGKDLGKWSVKNSTNNQADLMSQDGNKELNLKVMDNEYLDMDGNKYNLSQIGENNIYESDDHEVSMAMNLLNDIIKNANELKGKIGTTEIDLPGWVQDHISQSQNFINQANTGYNDPTNKGQLKSK